MLLSNRRFNLRLFFGLMVGCTFFVGGSYVLHAFQVKRTAGLLFHQALKAEDEDQLPKAVNYLRRYVALVPKDADATAKYSLLLANDQIATSPRAVLNSYYALEKALRLDPQRQDVRRRAVDVAMNPWMKRYNDAAEHIDRLFEAGVKDSELLCLRARCDEIAGKYKDARLCYQEAIALPKRDDQPFVRLAYLLRSQKDKARQKEKSDDEMFQLADKTVDDMLVAFNGSYRAFLWSANYHRQFTKDPEKGLERWGQDISKAVALAPTEADVLLSATELALQRKQIPAARAYMQEGVKLHPKDWRMYQTLGHVEMEDKQPAAAVAALKQGLTTLPRHLDLIWNLAHLYLRQDQNSEAETLLERLAKESFPARELDYLRARLLVNQEHWSDAARLLEGLYPQYALRPQLDQSKDWFSFNVAQECSVLLARCYDGMGDPYRAAAAYGRIVTLDPLSIAGRLGLARMEWVVGRHDIAVRHYRQLMEASDPPAAAFTECARLLIAMNLRIAKPDWNPAINVLKRAAKLKPVPVEVALLDAEVLAAQKQFDIARDLLTNNFTAIKERPAEIWVGLAALQERQGRQDEALAILNEAQRSLGDKLELRVARARYWARQGGPDALRALEKLGEASDKWSKADQRRLREELGDAYLRLGEKKLAAAQWRTIAKTRPDDVGSRLVLFDLALMDDDDKAMSEQVRDLKRIEDNDGSLWRFCKASQLIWQCQKRQTKTSLSEQDKTDLNEAGGLLAVVANRRSEWNRVPLAQARINELLGRSDAAIAKYRDAIRLGNQEPAVIRRLVLLLSSRGRYLEADEMLQKLKDQTGTLGDLNRVAAQVALQKRDQGLALDLARKAVPPQSKDFRDHIWLGQIFWAVEKLPEAEAELREAVKLSQSSPEPWVALVQFFMNTGAKAKAEATIVEAQKNIRGDKALLPLAYCHELVGQIDRAKQMYDDALAATPDNAGVLQALALFHLRQAQGKVADLRQSEIKKAQVCLVRIQELKTSSVKERSEARRILGLVLASSGDYQKTKAALEILGVVDDALPVVDAAEDLNLEDERAKMVILARQTNPRQRLQAIAILEKFSRLKSISDPEQYLLAQLYESVGEWPKARQQMLLLLTSAEAELNNSGAAKSNNQAVLGNYIVYFCNTLLRHDDVGQAQVWLARLEKLEPGSFRTLGTKARLLRKQDRETEAVAPLIELAGKNTDLVRPIAMLLEEIGQNKEAEKMFGRFVDQSKVKTPESVLVLAAFLGRQNRPDEALAVCEKAWANCKQEAVADTSVLVLYTAKSQGSHWAKVAGWLEKESKKAPTNATLLNDLSAVRRLQGDYDGVIALCRTCLVLNENDALAMNNVAWLLTLYKHDPEAALKMIQKAIDLKGPKAWLLGTRAVTLMKLGKAGQAVSDLRDAVAEMPSAVNYFHLAQAYLVANDVSSATAAFYQAQQLKLDESVVDPFERAEYLQIRKQLDKR